MAGFEDFRAAVFFAIGFLALLTLANFFRDAGLEGDFRAAVSFMAFLALVFFAVDFFAVSFLTLPALATFLRGAVVPAEALADPLGNAPFLAWLDVCPATTPPPRI